MRRVLAAMAVAVLVGTVVWLWNEPVRSINRTGGSERDGETSVSVALPVARTPAEMAMAEAAPSELAGPVMPQAKPRSIASVIEVSAEHVENASAAELPAATLLENVRLTMRQYASRFGGNPAGDNVEITAALNGANPKQIVFLNAEDGARVDAEGRLTDTWATPLFFHQISSTEIEIQSAGPDRRMWTSDDLVVK